MANFKATLDDRQERALFARYTPRKVEKILSAAGAAGARAAANVMRPKAPVGQGKREGQYYRRKHLGHGTFRGSVGARKVRRYSRGGIKGLQSNTLAWVVGPVGLNAFTRWWIEDGTKAHVLRKRGIAHPGAPARPWFRSVVGPASAMAQSVTEAILTRYANEVPRR